MIFALLTTMSCMALHCVYLAVLMGFDDDKYAINDNARGDEYEWASAKPLKPKT